jgi:hypothetical protein
MSIYGSLPDPKPDSNGPKREHMLRKFSSLGWHIKGTFSVNSPVPPGLTYTVGYQALIDPWAESREQQLVNYKIDCPNGLANDLLLSLRTEAKRLIYDAMEKAEEPS